VELEFNGKSTGYARVVFKECFHIFVVAGENEHDFTGQILDFCQEEIKDLMASIVLSGNELISFIDEKRATATVADLFEVLFASRYPIAGQSRARRLDKMIAGDHSHRTEELAIQASDGGLA